MALEQQHIGDWKVERIVEAAGEGFEASAARAALVDAVGAHPVVVFSFVDCPWVRAGSPGRRRPLVPRAASGRAVASRP